MAYVRISYTWPAGGELVVLVNAKARNVEALADMRIEAQRAWRDSCAELGKYDPEPEPAVTDG